MDVLTLVIGRKNLSSWSLRAWLALKRVGADFTEHVIPLDRSDTRAALDAQTPSGTVPVLRHGETIIWESLAICEHLTELFPEDAAAQATARAVSAEMHAGFAALRIYRIFSMRDRRPAEGIAPSVAEDTVRVLAVWAHCRDRFGGAPFLFGGFTLADAMFAPVVSCFRTYGVALGGADKDYADAVWELPEIQERAAAAVAEP
ncbi:MAG TPA: glutathione S-transferase [Rhodospirillales bacterium]|nr:glutathione S-transferase [Rhodospirillales bacterium]